MKRIAESVCEAVGVLVCYQKLCSRILDYKADSVFGVSGRDENERSSGFQKSLLRDLCIDISVDYSTIKNVYLGTQIETPDTGVCFGVVADTAFILICSYGERGTYPEFVLYKRR